MTVSTITATVWEFQLEPQYRQALNKEWKAAIATLGLPPSVMPLLLPNHAMALNPGQWCEHIYTAAATILERYPASYRRSKQYRTGDCGPTLRDFAAWERSENNRVMAGCARCERILRWRRLLG